jgi:hypothetical protein
LDFLCKKLLISGAVLNNDEIDLEIIENNSSEKIYGPFILSRLKAKKAYAAITRTPALEHYQYLLTWRER